MRSCQKIESHTVGRGHYTPILVTNYDGFDGYKLANTPFGAITSHILNEKNDIVCISFCFIDIISKKYEYDMI